jgi:hypothetical protein
MREFSQDDWPQAIYLNLTMLPAHLHNEIHNIVGQLPLSLPCIGNAALSLRKMSPIAHELGRIVRVLVVRVRARVAYSINGM